jgi:hypothetical protein
MRERVENHFKSFFSELTSVYGERGRAREGGSDIQECAKCFEV